MSEIVTELHLLIVRRGVVEKRRRFDSNGC